MDEGCRSPADSIWAGVRVLLQQRFSTERRSAGLLRSARRPLFDRAQQALDPLSVNLWIQGRPAGNRIEPQRLLLDEVLPAQADVSARRLVLERAIEPGSADGASVADSLGAVGPGCRCQPTSRGPKARGFSRPVSNTQPSPSRNSTKRVKTTSPSISHLGADFQREQARCRGQAVDMSAAGMAPRDSSRMRRSRESEEMAAPARCDSARCLLQSYLRPSVSPRRWSDPRRRPNSDRSLRSRPGS